MSERAQVVDDDTMKFGLLMESAQAHQRLAESHLEKLRAHTQDLDGLVREEIRRTLVDELKTLTAESDRAALALCKMKRAANMRGAMWTVGIAILCTAIPTVIARYALPSQSDIAAMRSQRDSLAQNIARLEQRGGKVDWRSCGDPARLCVHVDRKAPAYGEKSDYFIVKGY
ncbi:MAG: hypothetical protein ACLQO1_09985 [Steroidobacteraceae bacterium]